MLEKYAIIKSGGKQHLVTEGQTLLVDKLVLDEKKPLNFDQILLIKDKNKLEIGTPLVNGIVKASVLAQMKGKKIHISKFKAKTGYRRKIGFRALLTKVKIEEISLGKVSSVKEKGEAS